MSKIGVGVGVGKAFPLESDVHEQREREERQAGEACASGCGDWRDARDKYRSRRRYWRRHWRHGRPGFYLPRFLWIAAGVALIILAVKAPLLILAVIALGLLFFAARRHGFLHEIARDLREGWEGSDSWHGRPQGPRPQGPKAPRAKVLSQAAIGKAPRALRQA